MKIIAIILVSITLLLGGCETTEQWKAIGEAIQCEDRCNIDSENGKWFCNEDIVDMCNMKYPTRQYIKYLIENQNKIILTP